MSFRGIGTPEPDGEPAAFEPAAPGWVVESLIVIAALAVLCTFGVPAFHASVERDRIRDAFDYLSAVAIAQERFHLRHETYAPRLGALELHATTPTWFDVAAFRGSVLRAEGTGWELTLSRRGHVGGYGRYTITFSERGFEAATSTVDRFFDVSPWLSGPRS
jgi:type II secretory pathway pseudopilin PulG